MRRLGHGDAEMRGHVPQSEPPIQGRGRAPARAGGRPGPSREAAPRRPDLRRAAARLGPMALPAAGSRVSGSLLGLSCPGLAESPCRPRRESYSIKNRVATFQRNSLSVLESG